jgi:hypothetical protein
VSAKITGDIIENINKHDMEHFQLIPACNKQFTPEEKNKISYLFHSGHMNNASIMEANKKYGSKLLQTMSSPDHYLQLKLEELKK